MTQSLPLLGVNPFMCNIKTIAKGPMIALHSITHKRLVESVKDHGQKSLQVYWLIAPFLLATIEQCYKKIPSHTISRPKQWLQAFWNTTNHFQDSIHTIQISWISWECEGSWTKECEDTMINCPMKALNSFTHKSLESNTYTQTGLKWQPLFCVTQNWSVLKENPFTHKNKTKATNISLLKYNQSYPGLYSHNTD